MPPFVQELPIAMVMDASTIWILIPLSALGIGLVAILTGHQQKMAEIIHGRAHKEAVEAELQALRDKIAGLEARLSVQGLAAEAVSHKKSAVEDETVRHRLGS